MAIIKPIILYDGILNQEYPRALERAIWHINYWWFARELVGKYFRYLSPISISAPVNSWVLEGRDMWSAALTHIGNYGYPPWQYGEVSCIFIQGIPYTYPLGLGATGVGEPSTTGVLVKDGDALNRFVRGWTNIYDREFLENCGMFTHELGHAFGANNHEDPWGQLQNYEWEWWTYPYCTMVPANRQRLLRSIFFNE